MKAEYYIEKARVALRDSGYSVQQITAETGIPTMSVFRYQNEHDYLNFVTFDRMMVLMKFYDYLMETPVGPQIKLVDQLKDELDDARSFTQVDKLMHKTVFDALNIRTTPTFKSLRKPDFDFGKQRFTFVMALANTYRDNLEHPSKYPEFGELGQKFLPQETIDKIEYLLNSGHTNAELARLTGQDTSYISLIVAGKRSYKTMRKSTAKHFVDAADYLRSHPEHSSNTYENSRLNWLADHLLEYGSIPEFASRYPQLGDGTLRRLLDYRRYGCKFRKRTIHDLMTLYDDLHDENSKPVREQVSQKQPNNGFTAESFWR